MLAQLLQQKPALPEPIRIAVANWQIDMDAMIDRGIERVQRSHAQLVAQGLYDEQGNRLTGSIPYDMRRGSQSDVGG